MTPSDPTAVHPDLEPALILSKHLPYRLAIVAEAVNREVSGVYQRQYNLSRDEWRILAVLGELSVLKTRDVRAHTSLDKVQASRAIARMERSGLLARSEDDLDRRNHRLRLTDKGLALYRRLVPEVKAVEQRMLASFTTAESQIFNEILTRLLQATDPL